MTDHHGNTELLHGGAAYSYVRVKVCGITSREGALAAERAGADAVGFMFVEGSKRRITVQKAADIVSVLGPFMTKVGVFVDAPLSEVVQAVQQAGLDAVQLHGQEPADYAAHLTGITKVIKAVSFKAALTPDALADYPVAALLLDGAVPGSGTAFDWSRAKAWRHHPRLILAGGLNPGNVAEGVRQLAPYAVDVSSGVETSPGVKSEELMASFVRAARTAF